MNEHTIRKILEGGGGAGGRVLRAALWFPGVCYGAVMELRRTAYLAGTLQSHRAGAPVVSVGNLTAGGSGKTPFVAMLARAMLERGVKPGILLRGYRKAAGGESDEAVLYSRLCPDAIVRTGSDRRASAASAIALGAQILLMDDGFQHLKLKRDFDIVLVDATSPWGGGNTIPGGLLREPKSALRRVGAVVITRSDQCRPETLASIKEEVARLAPSASVFSARHKPVRLKRLDSSDVLFDQLIGKPVVALSGIARPEAFSRTLASLGAEVVKEINGRDHDDFTGDVLASAFEYARQAGAAVVITEKDRARRIFSELADNNVDNYNVWTLGVEQEVEDGDRLLDLLGNATGLYGPHG